MRTIEYLTVTMVLLGSVAAAQAEIYASGTLAFSAYSLQNGQGDPVDGDPDDEPLNYSGTHVNGTLGYISDSGFYGQVDLRFTQNSKPSADNHYEQGQFAAVRVGKAFDNFSVGAFVGRVETDTDNDATSVMKRNIYGVEGAYGFNNGLGVYAQLGRIGSPSGNDDTNGTDGIYDANFQVVGLTYDLNQTVGLRGYIGRVDGRMDSSNDAMDVKTLGFEATIDLGRGLSSSLSVEQNKLFQQESGGEEMTENRFGFGLTYNFNKGSKSRTRLQPLPSIENWMGQSGGPLE